MEGSTTEHGGRGFATLALAGAAAAFGVLVALAFTDIRNGGSANAALAQYEYGKADLTINQVDEPDPVVVGSKLRYSIFVANDGPDRAKNVVVHDTLPASVDFIAVRTRRGSCVHSGPFVGCRLGDFETGDRATITIVVRPTSTGRIRNDAVVGSETRDPEGENNLARTHTRVVGASERSDAAG